MRTVRTSARFLLRRSDPLHPEAAQDAQIGPPFRSERWRIIFEQCAYSTANATQSYGTAVGEKVADTWQNFLTGTQCLFREKPDIFVRKTGGDLVDRLTDET